MRKFKINIQADFAAGNFTKYLNQRISKNQRGKSI